MSFVWITRALVELIHEDQRQQHGGNAGVLNENSIESALARAPNKLEYSGAGVFHCAAASVFGLARNHGYQDANKRTAYMVGLTFLRLNGWRVTAEPQDVIALMVDVAVGTTDEDAIAAWLATRATRVDAG